MAEALYGQPVAAYYREVNAHWEATQSKDDDPSAASSQSTRTQAASAAVLQQSVSVRAVEAQVHFEATAVSGMPPYWSKMMRNTIKAIQEHRGPYYIRVQDLHLQRPLASVVPKSFVLSSFQDQGERRYMQDYYLKCSSPQGVLLAVFDGHGYGNDAVQFVKEQVQKRFLNLFEQYQQDIRTTFLAMISTLHQEVCAVQAWNCQGTTAVICFIDKNYNVYTATVGDSEANLYRRVKDRNCSIPLSCVRDWRSPKEAQRARSVLSDPVSIHRWENQHNVKRRFPEERSGINFSRSVGDYAWTLRYGKEIVLAHPKITMHYVQAGDTLTLVSDGVKDGLNEREAMAAFQVNASENYAKALVLSAKFNGSKDNMTAIAVKFE
ncbi:MAG: protein serine/threonine phosphatase 2C family protein [Verrucomicrobia bacterium]|nr:protein serine/threonine phosphatase 2C family protein [Verrucomicrobiota bacterium]MBS0647066.1 protein serine/threonine phosphatase 2C family protein [Verrucomicrobiota bacterium]